MLKLFNRKKSPAEIAYSKLSLQHRLLFRMEYNRTERSKYTPLKIWLITDSVNASIETIAPEATLISSAFIWSQSKMGFDYWQAVSNHYISKHFKNAK